MRALNSPTEIETFNFNVRWRLFHDKDAKLEHVCRNSTAGSITSQKEGKNRDIYTLHISIWISKNNCIKT